MIYGISAEWSEQFKGYRAVVTNQITNKVVYLGANVWKTELLAEGESEAYAVGYASMGENLANRYVRQYVKRNGK